MGFFASSFLLGKYFSHFDPEYKIPLPTPCALPPESQDYRVQSLNRPSFIMAVMSPIVSPIQPPPGSDVDFGAQIDGVNLENLTGE